jgi:hypothetical protein
VLLAQRVPQAALALPEPQVLQDYKAHKAFKALLVIRAQLEVLAHKACKAPPVCKARLAPLAQPVPQAA